MKWVTHEIVAVGAAYLLGMPPVALAGVFLGSVLPDMLDQQLAKLLFFRKAAFNRIHRGTTHWFGWWLALFAACFFHNNSLSRGDAPTLFLLGLGFGGLAHVLLDMCTITGVPVVPWSKKNMVALKLCRTGSLKEFAFLALFILFTGCFLQEDAFRLIGLAKKHLP